MKKEQKNRMNSHETVIMKTKKIVFLRYLLGEKYNIGKTRKFKKV